MWSSWGVEKRACTRYCDFFGTPGSAMLCWRWFPFTVFVDYPLEAGISSIFPLLNSHLQAERGELFVLCPISAGDGSRRKHARRWEGMLCKRGKWFQSGHSVSTYSISILSWSWTRLQNLSCADWFLLLCWKSGRILAQRVGQPWSKACPVGQKPVLFGFQQAILYPSQIWGLKLKRRAKHKSLVSPVHCKQTNPPHYSSHLFPTFLGSRQLRGARKHLGAFKQKVLFWQGISEAIDNCNFLCNVCQKLGAWRLGVFPVVWEWAGRWERDASNGLTRREPAEAWSLIAEISQENSSLGTQVRFSWFLHSGSYSFISHT